MSLTLRLINSQTGTIFSLFTIVRPQQDSLLDTVVTTVLSKPPEGKSRSREHS